MTREEEIQKEAKIFHASSDDYTVYKKGFEAGAEWADQHPRKGLVDIEKVIEWIKENAWLYDIVQVHCVQSNIDDIIHDLRKAMEL